MTLDSLVSSLGATSRNLGSHSLLLIQQQQVASASVQNSSGKAAGGLKGCGGALAVIKCCYNRLMQSKVEQRTRGIIVLSVEHPSEFWLHRSPASSMPSALTPQRLILDACTKRFQSKPTAAEVASSTPISLSSLFNTSVQTLATHEIKNLQALRAIIETSAKAMHEEYATRNKSASTTATAPPSATSSTSIPSNPYSLDADSSSTEAFYCDTVTIVIDDLVSLLTRFGTASIFAWLHGLKTSPLNLSLIVHVDLDGLTTLQPLLSGSGTGNAQPAYSSTSLHAHLTSLATTTVQVRSVQRGRESTSSGKDAYVMNVYLVHKRPSGKVTSVIEDMEIFVSDGLVKKVAGSVANKSATIAAPSASQPTGSLAQQFGSSFSLDLTSNAKAARANAVLPYQHTSDLSGGGVSSLDAPDEDDLLSEDDDEDFDDPDDDLEV